MFRAERADLLLFPDPTLDAALRSSSGAADGPETMVPVTVAGRRSAARPGVARGPRLQRPARPAWTTDAGAIREAMVGPLVGESGVIGALTIINRLGEGTSFEPDDLRLLETVANQAAVALENGQLEQSLHELSRLKEELRHQAFHDSLTGLPNRPAFVEEVERRARRDATRATRRRSSSSSTSTTSRSSTTRSGHAAGDELLVAVAERIGDQLRPGDLVARFGGDEFALLPVAGSTVDDALAMTQRIIAGLELPFRVAGHGRPRRLQRRHQRGPRRRAGRRSAAQRRRRDVPGQGRRQAPGAGLRSDHAQLDRRAPRADLGPRPERQPRRPDRRLPADRRADQRPDRRRRGARALEPPDPRRRSTRPSSSAWPRRTARSWRSAGPSSQTAARQVVGMASAARPVGARRCRSTCRRSSSSTRASSTRSRPRSRRPGSTRAT